MYNVKHPVYRELQQIGNAITKNVKPKAIVVFSAHWQASAKDTIEVNIDEETDLIYE